MVRSPDSAQVDFGATSFYRGNQTGIQNRNCGKQIQPSVRRAKASIGPDFEIWRKKATQIASPD
jgi:hypothetical protein